MMPHARLPMRAGGATPHADSASRPAPIELAPSSLERAIEIAAEALLERQRPDGHWVFELEADATIPAEYVALRHFLGEADAALEAKIARYLRRVQGAHGGWPLYNGGDFNLSASVKAYLALKLIGDAPEAPHMRRAREAILAHGGAGETNVFTRVLLALFDFVSWDAVPLIPVEIMLFPRWFPFSLARVSYWSRTVMVPLLVLAARKPRARNLRGVRIDELFARGIPRARRWIRGAHQPRVAYAAFAALDGALRLAVRFVPRSVRERAIAAAVAFVRERLNGVDGLGAIFPAMANAVMMLDALGRARDDPDLAVAREAVDRLLVVGPEEAYCQPCVSPVWDTVLACHALLEAGGAAARAAACRSLEWLERSQVVATAGDWIERRPHVRPGGWAFQYANPHYPDLDDTAAVVMAMERFARGRAGREPDFRGAIRRGSEWVLGLQSANGGWGAFDVDNTSYYLNDIPFADHGALLDPPTADVTARCAGMIAQLGAADAAPSLARALRFLRDEQEADGSWYGRWGMNYTYGTWSVLCAFSAAGVAADAPEVRRAAKWLVSTQNDDGGWGEAGDSYALDHRGHERAASTPSQTAWALLGLMAAGEVRHPAVADGIAYLQQRQSADGFWDEPEFTATGFPRVFYLRYHGYAKYFPLWALARYRNLTAGGRIGERLGM